VTTRIQADARLADRTASQQTG